MITQVHFTRTRESDQRTAGTSNSRDGLWWEGNGDPDFETPDENDNFSETFEFRYTTRGNYRRPCRLSTASVRRRPQLSQFAFCQLRTLRLPQHTVPYVLEQGADLELNGSGTDQNIGCGDRITIDWDLDNDGNFDDAQGATPTVAWATFQNLALEQPQVVRIRVRDQAGATATAETTLTIYPRDPVAVARAQPNPATASKTSSLMEARAIIPNPQRSISNYDWDVDGQAGFEGGSERFTYAYRRLRHLSGHAPGYRRLRNVPTPTRLKSMSPRQPAAGRSNR